MRALAILIPVLMVLAACGGSADHDHHHHGHDATPPPAEGSAEGAVKPYPLDVCLVMDVPLDSMGGVQTLVHEGQEWKFCCGGCVSSFQADPEHWTERLQAAVAAAAE